ncbi:MAG: type II toxin-antitoxin system YafQ family toxin [Roseburia sp.]|nr:type II toxin-antitoxin system YafQ family toxin [Anaeroplasma bactoclasticum]MCM1196353.1 type II toxin-antitoxin system YafQ family toxin [Roseburia sp.]
MKYKIQFTTQFQKDIKKAKKQGKDLDKLFSIIEMLSNGETLPPKYKDHNLSGTYSGVREYHNEPDRLLIYSIKDDVLILVLNRVGSHSDLFK